MNAFSDSQFSVRAYLKGKKIQISITSLVLIVFYSLDLRKYYISNTLMTQENKLEREREREHRTKSCSPRVCSEEVQEAERRRLVDRAINTRRST